MPEVIDWRGGAKARAVRRAARALAEGRCVGLPTEASYGVAASALVPEAVAGRWLTVALRAGDAPDWVPG